MSEHRVSGQLAGQYRILLGRSTSERDKSIEAVLHIDADNAWSVRFIVTETGRKKEWGGLSQAIRHYDNA